MDRHGYDIRLAFVSESESGLVRLRTRILSRTWKKSEIRTQARTRTWTFALFTPQPRVPSLVTSWKGLKRLHGPWTIVPIGLKSSRTWRLNTSWKSSSKPFLCFSYFLNDGIFAKSEKYIYEQFTITIPHCHFYISNVSKNFSWISKLNDQELQSVHLVVGFSKSMKCTFYRSDFGWIIERTILEKIELTTIKIFIWFDKVNQVSEQTFFNTKALRARTTALI